MDTATVESWTMTRPLPDKLPPDSVREPVIVIADADGDAEASRISPSLSTVTSPEIMLLKLGGDDIAAPVLPNVSGGVCSRRTASRASQSPPESMPQAGQVGRGGDWVAFIVAF